MRLHYIFSLLFLLCPGMGGTGPSVCDHMLNQALNLQSLSSSTQMSASVQLLSRDLIDCNTPGFSVHHQLLVLTKSHGC